MFTIVARLHSLSCILNWTTIDETYIFFKQKENEDLLFLLHKIDFEKC